METFGRPFRRGQETRADHVHACRSLESMRRKAMETCGRPFRRGRETRADHALLFFRAER